MNQSLSQRAYDYLINGFLSHQFRPGDLVDRRKIASNLNISAAPVLEAMVRLETEGFVETLPRRGTRVRLVTLERVKDALIIRIALECQSARMICGNPIKNNEAAILKLARKVDTAEPFSKESWEADLEFHKSLMEMAQSQALLQEFLKYVRLSFFFEVSTFRLLFSNPKAGHSHAELVQGLKTTKPEQAEKVMRIHLRSGKGAILNAIA